jgi:hypothetical protein
MNAPSSSTPPQTCPAVLGTAEPAGPGLTDLLRPDASIGHLAACLVDLGAMDLLPYGNATIENVPSSIWPELGKLMAADSRHWIVDAGHSVAQALAPAADNAILVTRHCYLALRAAQRLAFRPSGVVSIHEDGRVLATRDIERVIGAPVITSIPVTADMARCVDAGLLAIARIPRQAHAAMRRLHTGSAEPAAADSPTT